MMLLKPQVKSHIKQECVKITSGTNGVLVKAMDKPCKLIAESLSDCIIKKENLERFYQLFQIYFPRIVKQQKRDKEMLLTIGLPKY